PGPRRSPTGRTGPPSAHGAAAGGGGCRPAAWHVVWWSWCAPSASHGRTAGALARDQAVADDDRPRCVLRLGPALEQKLDRGLGDGPLVGGHGAQARRAEPALLDVVDADDGDVLRGAAPAVPQRAQRTQ